MTRSNPAIAVGFANKKHMKGMVKTMLQTEMASAPWMRAQMKGRSEVTGPVISELSSSVQKIVKCLLHFHAYLVVVGLSILVFPTPF